MVQIFTLFLGMQANAKIELWKLEPVIEDDPLSLFQ